MKQEASQILNDHGANNTENQSNMTNSLVYNQVVDVQEFYQDGSSYIGQKLNNMRHGKGKFHFQDGGYYDGNWKNDLMDGYGVLYYSRQIPAYDGNWVEDKFHGNIFVVISRVWQIV